MFGEIFGRGGCCKGGERKGKICLPFGTSSSCDVLFIIILLMVVFNGGLFGIDLCTLAILAVVFGPQLLCKKPAPRPCH